MKLTVSKKGVFDQDGKPVKVGASINIDGSKVPAWLAGKVEVAAKPVEAKEMTVAKGHKK